MNAVAYKKGGCWVFARLLARVVIGAFDAALFWSTNGILQMVSSIQFAKAPRWYETHAVLVSINVVIRSRCSQGKTANGKGSEEDENLKSAHDEQLADLNFVGQLLDYASDNIVRELQGLGRPIISLCSSRQKWQNTSEL